MRSLCGLLSLTGHLTSKTPGNFPLLPFSAEPPDLVLWFSGRLLLFLSSFLTKFLFYALAGQALGLFFFYPIIITPFSLDSVFLAYASFSMDFF